MAVMKRASGGLESRQKDERAMRDSRDEWMN
jgi:hypothetical protein